ncbi:putative metalloprotease [Amycolatopsis bartoniae]|uniref:Aminopeptidase n=1 Tax=Amycolatopsis bartoniae TaxID=941986 RepID=A0A8H9IYQ6_9PSEU|nr:neutral zinc metallopeptidase [Amycolatopsis bartoniae]MBB2934354.1 putative metalloprotease [Amycolatopsis bartoniae]TVT00168.1 aminopeptidase [Amycolatopsis bartoniae]GHF47967.1 aminopeptidase [Amycolatopsis bartoniae]
MRAGALAVAIAGTLVLAACGGNDGGTAAGSVAGLPVTHFESGLRPDAPTPDLDVRNVSDDDADRLATATIADVEDYWSGELPDDFGVKFDPVEKLLSYESNGTNQTNGCGDTKKNVNAFYCGQDDSIAWDRGVLLPTMIQQFGPLSVVTVLSHEFGHAVQYRLQDKAGITRSTPTIVKEQQADCFAGSYYRWVAEGKSKYFRVSTAEGLNAALSSLFLVRDSAGTAATDNQAHGTAFDRIFAFQLGFEQGPKECAKIDMTSLQSRLTERPFDQADRNEGTLPINDTTLDFLKQSLDAAFAGAHVPSPEIVPGSGACSGGPATPPASYCPSDNTVNIDVDTLAALGREVNQSAEWNGETSGGHGDFAALSEIASRYALAIEKGVGASLDNANAGLRTACLVGAWAAATNKLPNTVLRLSAGDLDEAISDLLRPDSLVAADVNGKRVDAGFTRVEAMRTGYLKGSTPCSKQYG